MISLGKEYILPILSILLGISLVFLLANIKQPTAEMVRNKQRTLKKVSNNETMKEVTDASENIAGIFILLALGFLIASIIFYIRFWNDNNLVSYMWGTILFILCAICALGFKSALRFLMRMKRILRNR